MSSAKQVFKNMEKLGCHEGLFNEALPFEIAI